MVACICHAVSDDVLEEIIDNHGCQTIEDIRDRIDICQSCRQCEMWIEKMLESNRYANI